MLNPNVISNLKSVDPDRYRAAQFADRAARDRLWLVYSFHAELAKVPELVSEPMIGAIRYQWWRDAIDEMFTDRAVRAHEITTPLSQLVSEKNLSRYRLEKLIDGRERDLDPTPFSDLEDARAYCRATSGLLMQLAAKTVVADFDEDGLLKAGEAWGLTGLARAWGYYHDTMLSNLDFLKICQAAGDTYIDARTKLGKFPAELMPAIAYAALIPKYLKRLGASDFDPLQHRVQYTPFLKQMRLISAVMRSHI